MTGSAIGPQGVSDALSITLLWATGASDTELKAAATVAVKMAPRSRGGFVGWLRKKGLL
ncbi:hypothetical protein NBRC116589_23250 [Ruegeria sp. HU-ET01832]